MFWRLCETGLKQGLEISQTVHSAPFFFFEFQPESVVSVDLGRFRPESKPRRHESEKITWNPRGTTRWDVQATASPARRCVPPRWTRVRHLWCRVRASQHFTLIFIGLIILFYFFDLFIGLIIVIFNNFTLIVLIILRVLFFFFFEIIQTKNIGNGEGGSGKIRLTTLTLTKMPNLCKYQRDFAYLFKLILIILC